MIYQCLVAIVFVQMVQCCKRVHIRSLTKLEGFGDVILKGAPMTGASIVDGLESVRAMVAVMRSAETGQPVKLADATGPV